MIMSCKQATELASQRLDLKPRPAQRLGLTLHLLICRHCRRYVRQLAFLQRAAPGLEARIEAHSELRLPPERKEKIRQSLEP